MIDLGGHRLVERHFQGERSPRAGRRLFRHLRRCARCRNEYRILSSLEALGGDGEASARERLAGAIFPRRSRRSRRLAWGAGGLGIAFACAALVIWFGGAPDGFRARGGSARIGAAPPAAAGLAIYRVPPAGGGSRVGRLVSPGEALAFTYSNPPPEAYSHLMVLARDSAGQVRWFWPAWQDPGDDPASISIAAGREPVELGEAVRHAFPPGPLTVIGIFSRRPYRVSDVEAALAEGGGVGGLAKLDARVWSESLEVVTSPP